MTPEITLEVGSGLSNFLSLDSNLLLILWTPVEIDVSLKLYSPLTSSFQ